MIIDRKKVRKPQRSETHTIALEKKDNENYKIQKWSAFLYCKIKTNLDG